MKQFKELGIHPSLQGLIGDKIKIDRILNREIIVERFEIKDSKFEKGNGKCLYLQIEVDSAKRVVFTGARTLMEVIAQIPKDAFPFATKIVKENESFQFT